MIKFPSQVNKALASLEKAGHRAYIVGGCVRNSLLGLTPGDYDITTSALPAEIEEAFKGERIIETGIAHGTVTVILDDMPLEITTYRIDGSYTDHRHPDFVSFTDRLEEDLARRDFTMNALAYSPQSGIVDFFKGREDIKAGLIRCVGDGDLRFNEDALRILRALRFSSVLGFQIEEDTKNAAFRNKQLLAGVSNERVRDELIKLLCGKNVRRVIGDYAEIIAVVIPELLPLIGFEPLERTSRMVENASAKPILRLAAFFHSFGEGAGEILTRLRMDRASKEQILKLILALDEDIPADISEVCRAMGRLSPPLFFKLLELKGAYSSAFKISPDDFREQEELAREILKSGRCFNLKSLAIRGEDLLSLGFKGRLVGQMLELALNAVIDGKAENSREALIELIKSQPQYHR